MPTYSFRNKDTGEIFDKLLKIAERDEYLTQNPHLESIITSAPAFAGDHITLKKDTGFKEVLQKIKERNPRNDLHKTSSQL
jgi:hypothetical protein